MSITRSTTKPIVRGITRGIVRGGLDADAAAYIAAVEAADGQALEPAVRVAYDQFIRGCKADGIWDAIKASCILAGARTLSGALVPLKGTAPTSFNFVSGDYNRETGLLGNAAAKYLGSNRNNNADPQNNKSVSTWVTFSGSSGTILLGSGGNNVGATTLSAYTSSTRHNCQTVATGALTGFTGFFGASRSNSAGYTKRVNGANTAITQASQTPFNSDYYVFATNISGVLTATTDARIGFYHIGESLDLAALDSRVSTLMSDLAAAIP